MLALNDRDEPLQSDTPFISHIDGLPISHWQKIANHFLPPEQQNSVQMQMPWLQQLDLLRREMGLRVKEEVLLTLYGADLQPQNIEMKVPLQFRSAPLSILASWQQLAPDTALFSLTDLNAIETDPQLQQDLLRAMSNHTLVLDLRHARGFSDSLLQFLGNYHNGSAANLWAMAATAAHRNYGATFCSRCTLSRSLNSRRFRRCGPRWTTSPCPA